MIGTREAPEPVEEGPSLESAEDSSRRRRLADEFLFAVASSTYRVEELEASLRAAREQLDGVGAVDPSRERVSGGFTDPDAIANRIQAVSAMEERLSAARERREAVLRIYAEVCSELSQDSADLASSTVGEHSLGLRSSHSENVARMRAARERLTPEEAVEGHRREAAMRRELADLLERRGLFSCADIWGGAL